jgi:hypothetical protein
MARLSTVSSFFLSQIGVREFLPDININSNILTEESVVNILQYNCEKCEEVMFK